MTELKTTIKPLGTRVLLLPLEEESRTSTGIFIPDTAKEKPQRGEVIAVGDEEDEIKVKVGQVVLFPKYSGTDIKLNGVDHIIMESDDILAILAE
ncbi:MAG: co-chaperone GroES [Anaerolineales bacterium]|jgi:chaperonin GroES